MLNLERDDFLHRFMAHDSFARHFDFFAHGSEPVVLSSADLVFLGAYSRTGDDLVIDRSFESVTIHDYFKPGNHPEIQAPGGAALSSEVVSAMTLHHGGEEYAANAAAAAAAPKAIGRVEEITGTAEAIRSGQSIALHPGDLVYKGDAVQTGPDSNLALTFLDGTAFSLAADARMVLNDMTYEPKSSSNASLLTLVQGSIGFVAGDVAHTGDMKVDTPVSTMGIRGTAVKSRISFDQGKGECTIANANAKGKGEFSLLKEPDGHVGSIVFYDRHVPGAVQALLSSASTVLTFVCDGGKLVTNYSPSTDFDNNQDQDLTKFLFHIRQLGFDHPLRAELGLDQPGAGQGGQGGGSPQTPEQQQGQEQGAGSAGPPPQVNQNPPAINFVQPLQSNFATPALGGPSLSLSTDTGVTVSYTTPTVGGTTPVKDPPTLASGSTEIFKIASSTSGNYGQSAAGEYGTASIDPSTGIITYKETNPPPAGSAPTDSFAVKITDSHGVTTTTTASFVVDGGTSTNYGLPELAVGQVTNSPTLKSPEGGDNFVLGSQQGLYGTATISAANGAITYTPTATAAPGQALTDTFTVTDTDKLGVMTKTIATFVIDGGTSVNYGLPELTSGANTPVTNAPVLISPEGGDKFTLVSAQGTAETSAQGIDGTATIDPTTGAITYTPTTTATPSHPVDDTFVVKDTDSLGVTTTTTATFSIYEPALPAGQTTISGPSAGDYRFAPNATSSLVLANPSTYGGQFTGFSGSDTIDLQGFAYSSAAIFETYVAASNSLVLTVGVPTETGERYSALTFDNFGTATQSLLFSSDKAGGTLISVVAAPPQQGPVSAASSTTIQLPAGEILQTHPAQSADGASLTSASGGILYDPAASSALSQLNYGQSEVDHVTVVAESPAGTIAEVFNVVVEGLDHGPVISGLVASASAGSGNTTDITITGAATGLDDLGSIQFDVGGSTTPFSVTGGTFSIAASLSPGDHVATLTLEDQSTLPGSVSGLTTRQIDIDIGGGDAATMTSSTGGPAILVGSSNSAVSQTIVGTPYADTLVAGAGNDVLTGKGGGDTFVFKPTMGNDVITDFHANSGSGPTDVVDLTAFHFASYQALLSNVTDTPAGEVITLGTHTVTLDGVHTAQLNANLFHL